MFILILLIKSISKYSNTNNTKTQVLQKVSNSTKLITSTLITFCNFNWLICNKSIAYVHVCQYIVGSYTCTVLYNYFLFWKHEVIIIYLLCLSGITQQHVFLISNCSRRKVKKLNLILANFLWMMSDEGGVGEVDEDEQGICFRTQL